MTKEMFLSLRDSDNDRVLIRSIPEADLVLTIRMTGTLEFWCLKKKSLEWSFDLKSVLNHSVEISLNPAFDYELDGRSSIKIAMCVESKKR